MDRKTQSEQFTTEFLSDRGVQKLKEKIILSFLLPNRKSQLLA